jgi:hypothetical protein
MNSSIKNSFITPKLIILDIKEELEELGSLTYNEPNSSYAFFINNKDHINIFSDIFSDIALNPSDVFCKVNIDLLISAGLKDSTGKCSVFGELFKQKCNSIKFTLINKIISFKFDSIIESEQGYFNYYLKEIRGNTAILQHLSN